MSLPSKKQLRAEALAKRQSISAADHAVWSANICTRLESICSFLSARNIALYMPIKNEADTTLLAHHYQKKGITFCLPVIQPDNTILAFHSWKPGDALVTDRYGISHPAKAQPVYPDTVLVPCVAYDRQCHRLGYGAGYYDSTLEHIRAKPIGPFTAIGIAFSLQEIPSIPTEAFDQRLNMMVTEREMIVPGA